MKLKNNRRSWLPQPYSIIYTAVLLFCQLFFYVTSLQPLEPTAALTEENLPLVGGEREQYRKTYLYRHIHYLRQAVKPRPITYLDTALYRQSGVYSQNGILFTVKQPTARQVFFVCDADHFQPRLMTRGKMGVWYYLYVPPPYEVAIPNKKLRYKFLIDNHFQHDTTHDQLEEDGAGGFLSLYYLTEEDFSPKQGAIVLKQAHRFSKEVYFRLKTSPQTKQVAVIGNFNNWNGELDLLQREANGLFVLRKFLPPGEYVYLFKVDGENQLDLHNLELRYHPVFGKVNYLKVP